MKKSQQYACYFIVPFSVALLAVFSEYSGFDVWLESFFYDSEAGVWPYKSLFITSTVLHEWSRNLVVLIASINLVVIVVSFFNKTLSAYRKHMVYIFIAAVTGPLLVGILKKVTHIYCPWSLEIFGADMTYIRIFDAVPPGSPVGYCFPGGHSSGGFAYLSAYFALLVMGNKYRYYGLIIPVMVGILFSVTQEIRGAHFLSHDLLSFSICWTVSLLISMMFYPDYYKK